MNCIRTRALLNLLKAKLAQRITFWVFISIVVIEAIILVPSYYRREQELLKQLEEVSKAAVATVNAIAMGEKSKEEILRNTNSLRVDRRILGFSLYTKEGKLVTSGGEVPAVWPSNLSAEEVLRCRSDDGNRYDVAWPSHYFNDRYIFMVRHDATLVNQELKAFVLRIAGLVVIISLVVTATTLTLIGVMVIGPILSLRDDLKRAGEVLSRREANPQFYSSCADRRDELKEVSDAFLAMFQRVHQAIAEQQQAEMLLRQEKEKSESLLLNILPQPIAERLKQSPGAIADGFAEATVLFADIVDFTGLASRISPTDLVCLLNRIFSAFDDLATRHGLEKIKTIGDAYMVVGGVPSHRHDHAEAIAAMALDMRHALQQFVTDQGEPFQIRIGINTGPVVAGVIGTRKFTYDLWGDVVNIASRMESHGLPGCIQVTEATYQKIAHCYHLESRGSIYIKGRGEMNTYLLLGRAEPLATTLTSTKEAAPSFEDHHARAN